MKDQRKRPRAGRRPDFLYEASVIKMADFSEIGEKGVDIELDLSLSLGRSFRRSGRTTLKAEESVLFPRENRRGDSMMNDGENESSVTDGIQTLGRKDAKRHQKENRKKREIGGVEGLNSGAEGEEMNEKRRRKREITRKTQDFVDLNLSNQSFLPCRLFPISPMQYSHTPVQYLSAAHPCVMPRWGPGSGAASFKPYQVNRTVNQSGECKFNNGRTEKSSDGTLTCSSSVIADNQSCFSEGLGSRSRSCQSLPDLESNGSTGNNDSNNHSASSRPPDDHNVAESFDKDAVPGDRKVLKSSRKIKNDKFHKPRTHLDASISLSSMPCVSAMGDGPDSKRINGFLYRYTKSEVRIICVCHGKSFSPAEFVKHAGGKEESNPLRQITVTPFALA